MPSEECQSLEDVKARQDKLDTRLNEHSERIVRVESKMDTMLNQVTFLAGDVKLLQASTNELKLGISSATTILEGIKSVNDKEASTSISAFIVDVFKDAVKVVIIAAFVSAIAYAVLNSKL